MERLNVKKVRGMFDFGLAYYFISKYRGFTTAHDYFQNN